MSLYSSTIFIFFIAYQLIVILFSFCVFHERFLKMYVFMYVYIVYIIYVYVYTHTLLFLNCELKANIVSKQL